MPKQLELTIYPHHPKHLNTNWLTMYVTPDGPMAAGRGGELPAAKHFTDAELAAEYWAACANCATIFPRPLKEWERAETLHRFATTPHYFEAGQ